MKEVCEEDGCGLGGLAAAAGFFEICGKEVYDREEPEPKPCLY